MDELKLKKIESFHCCYGCSHGNKCENGKTRDLLIAEIRACWIERENIRLVISEASIQAPSIQFTAYGPDGIHAIEPSSVTGVFEHIELKLRELGNWNVYDEWQRLLDVELLLQAALVTNS